MTNGGKQMNLLEFCKKTNELYLELRLLEELLEDAEKYGDQFREGGKDECTITFWDGRVSRNRHLRVSKKVIERSIRQEKIILFEKINKIEHELLALVNALADSAWVLEQEEE